MNNHHCPHCHTSIPANAPGGLCPACILRDANEVPLPSYGAPSIDAIAAAFPQLDEITLIGQGGMGFVYKAHQPKLDRVIALKILAPELSRDPAFAERFAREARTLGKLHHQSIVSIFEHGESGGFYYLMMEYVDGVNLRQAMRAGRFTPQQALAIIPGICDALQFAHEQGVWHRDIKPENILLDREGRVKIADFGIARIVGDPQRDFTLTMTGNALGSAAYMAPEQHEKPHEVDHRADIYSLGVVIYEMLTGELPLGRFPSPSQRAAVDTRIDEIVLKTLEKERELRQQSVTEVKTDMHRAMQPGAIQKTASATSGSAMSKLAFWTLLSGIAIPLILGIISMHLAEIGFMVSALLMVVTLILGFMSWRDKLGKVSAISSMLILLLYGAMIAMMSRGPGVASSQLPSDGAENSEESPAPELPTAPTVPVEAVLRKMVTAANESDGTEFNKHVKNLWLIHAVSVGPGGAPIIASSERPDLLTLMELFHGEIVYVKVAAAVDQPAAPEAHMTIRKRDGSLIYQVIKFESYDGRWVATSARTPFFRATSRIEFQPSKGDPAKILEIHLEAVEKLRAVEGKPGQFDIIEFANYSDLAKDRVDETVHHLQESLKKFNLDSALKIISPAVAPEAPYMAEDEPPYEEPKS